MSHLRKKTRGSLTAALISNLTGVVGTHRAHSGVVGSLESMDEAALAETSNSYDDAENAVKEQLKNSLAEEQSVDVDQIDDEELADYSDGIEAAAIVLMSHDKLRGFREASMTAQAKAGLNVVAPISGSFGDVSAVGALEAFDVNKIDTFKAESISYNLQAPRQDAFAEMFYRTYIGTPDQAMFKATIDRVMIAPRVEHTLDGEAKHFGKRNVLEAYRDHTILDDNSTDLVPNFDDAQNGTMFVPTAQAPVETVVVNGVDVPTKPLKVNQKIGLIGISSNSALIAAGLMDQNESVDHNAGIAKVLVEITDGETTEYIYVPTLRHPSAKFVKTPQGHGLDANSRLRVEHLLKGEVLMSNGNVSTLLEPVLSTGKQLTVQIGADTDLNFERGVIEMSPRNSTFTKLTDPDGKELALADETALKDVTMKIVGFTPDARRTNSTRRSAGHRVDVDRWEEVYPVGLLAPIVAQDPTSPYNTDSKMKALVQATHVRINNSAVTALLNTAEHLSNVVDATLGGFITADSETGGSVEGIARMVLKAHYRESEVDLPAVINNISSKDKLRDIQGYFIALINEIAYRMVQNSGYRIASRALNGGVERDVKLLIGTDEVMPAFMMIQGDDRTAGIKLKYQIESSSDARMFGKVILALGEDGSGFLPLNFGNFLWIPELVSEIPVNRNGTTIRETMVQPRFRHICNTPVMEVINVKGLEDVIKNRTAIDFNDISAP